MQVSARHDSSAQRGRIVVVVSARRDRRHSWRVQVAARQPVAAHERPAGRSARESRESCLEGNRDPGLHSPLLRPTPSRGFTMAAASALAARKVSPAFPVWRTAAAAGLACLALVPPRSSAQEILNRSDLALIDPQPIAAHLPTARLEQLAAEASQAATAFRPVEPAALDAAAGGLRDALKPLAALLARSKSGADWKTYLD